jgi:adenosylcobinamide-phosphate synthase
MEIIFILILAFIIDIALGDPANAWHPVAWLGKLISLEMKLAPRQGKTKQLAFGIAAVVITMAVVTAAAYFLFAYLKEINLWLYIIIAALFLKFTFSIRGLRQAAITIKRLLSKDKLSEARLSLRSLVSRDTANMDKSQVVAATVESVAENSCDSFIAPLFYFLIFGVPGAIAYRIINTFDAMIGYHGEYEYLGKAAARLDDAANFIPARITAIIIVLAAWICGKNISQAWHIMIRDHGKTQSPNAGWTMSAIAGALGIQLEKAGHYKLGDNHYSLSLNAIDASVRIVMVTAIIWSLLSISVQGVYLAAS